MDYHRIDLIPRPGLPDARGAAVLEAIHTSGFGGVERIDVSDIYFVAGIARDEVDDLVHKLLLDPVTHASSVDARPDAPDAHVVEVSFLPGVTDSVGESLMGAARTLAHQPSHAASAVRFTLVGDVDGVAADAIAKQILCNDVVEQYVIDAALHPPFVEGGPQASAHVEHVSLTELDDEGLLAVSKTRRLSLNLEEMQTIQAHYRSIGRQPTDLELEMLAQTWSEHCVHKTFKARIEYTELDAAGDPVPGTAVVVDSLLKSYIAAATDKAGRDWIRSAFVDNAGIVAFDDKYDLAFKVETHNHPSAIEPFGGSNTGVGGVVRDILGVSARPIANTDILCFGPQNIPHDQLPEGVLHPRRVATGVIEGVGDYGNKMGIPTVNGGIVYDAGYVANPLVFVGCLGLLPRDSHPTSPQPGDRIVVIGGRTGRDGLRGATFSSMEMSTETAEIAGSSVQIGHPIHEKQVLEVVLQARDERLYTAVTDCGAGGLSSAIGEMGEKLGGVVQLERVPLKYPGLTPWEIWLSEAQERMVFAVPDEHWDRMQQLCAIHQVDVADLGRFGNDGQLVVRFGDTIVGELEGHFLHDGIPQRQMKATWQRPSNTTLDIPENLDASEVLLALVAAPASCSRELVVRTYDHEVQGGTVVKPFVGPRREGPGDGAVLAPLESWQWHIANGMNPVPGVALGNGVNPAYGALDPWAMAWAAVDEAFRNAVAVGADPDRIALLDNFCWGNPNLPDRLGSLLLAARGCHDAAVAYGAPFVSGKDSLNNEYTGADGDKHAIPGTILVSALGIVPDIEFTATADAKAAGNLIYVVGETRDELGGSALAVHLGQTGLTPPQPPTMGKAIFVALHHSIASGLVQSCHDCSEGGLALALAELGMSGGLGIEADLAEAPGANGLSFVQLAFSESLARFVVEVSSADADAFEAGFTGLPCARVGAVVDGPFIRISSGDNGLELSLDAVTRAHKQ